MGANMQERPRRTFRRVLKLACVCLLLAVVLLYFLTYRPKLPDLTTCTRIKVQYGDGALYHFFPSTARQESLLSEEERKYVRSYDTWTVTDQKQIQALAHHVRQSTYQGRLPLLVWLFGKTDPPTNIVGYQSGAHKISFSVYGPDIITAGGRRFTYSAFGFNLALLDPPGIESLQTRWKCAENLSRLTFEGLWQSPYLGRLCPDPNHWGDTIVQHSRRAHIIQARWFACPSVRAATDKNDTNSQSNESDSWGQTPNTWTSDYAMNSNCREDSPADMVFLFESRPGWNQHGGPELFTFDNHNPKGGLVLLNDGTVKFIRTEEELKRLRWK